MVLFNTPAKQNKTRECAGLIKAYSSEIRPNWFYDSLEVFFFNIKTVRYLGGSTFLLRDFREGLIFGMLALSDSSRPLTSPAGHKRTNDCWQHYFAVTRQEKRMREMFGNEWK